MADFDQTREQLRRSRQERDAALDALTAAGLRLRRNAARAAELDRVFRPNDEQAAAERNRLARERQALEAEIERLRGAGRAAQAAEAAAVEGWIRLSDPR